MGTFFLIIVSSSIRHNNEHKLPNLPVSKESWKDTSMIKKKLMFCLIFKRLMLSGIALVE